MQLLNERMLQDATAWLSEQRQDIRNVYTKINRARQMTNAGRSLCLFGLLFSPIVAVGAVIAAFTTPYSLLQWLPHVYWPTQTLSLYALPVSLLLLSVLCLANAWRLYFLLRDDSKAHKSLLRLKEIDRRMADHIARAPEIARDVDARLRSGHSVPLFAGRSPEEALRRLAAFAGQRTASGEHGSSGFVRALYVANLLAWGTTASALLMGEFLAFITTSQQWYTWDTSAVDLARWAFPASLLLLMLLAHQWLLPADQVCNPARLLVLVPLVPLAILLGWGIAAVPHFVVILAVLIGQLISAIARFLWDVIKVGLVILLIYALFSKLFR